MRKHTDAVHKKMKPFLCDVCCFATATKGSLKSHQLAVHDKVKAFKCDMCEYRSCTRKAVSHYNFMIFAFEHFLMEKIDKLYHLENASHKFFSHNKTCLKFDVFKTK